MIRSLGKCAVTLDMECYSKCYICWGCSDRKTSETTLSDSVVMAPWPRLIYAATVNRRVTRAARTAKLQFGTRRALHLHLISTRILKMP
jgi:hypothetical protein